MVSGDLPRTKSLVRSSLSSVDRLEMSKMVVTGNAFAAPAWSYWRTDPRAGKDLETFADPETWYSRLGKFANFVSQCCCYLGLTNFAVACSKQPARHMTALVILKSKLPSVRDPPDAASVSCGSCAVQMLALTNAHNARLLT